MGAKQGVWDIAFVAAGGGAVGMGHIARCCSIAQALDELGLSAGVLCLSEEAVPIVEARGVRAEALAGNANAPLELERACSALSRLSTRLVVVDRPKASPLFLSGLRAVCKVGVITPTYDAAPSADVVINYGGYKGAEYYGASWRLAGRRCLFGMGYAPLAREYWDMSRREPSKHVERLLLTCGGADPFDVIPALMDKLDASGVFAGVVKDIVVGRFASYPEGQLAAWEERQDVAVHFAPSCLAGIEAECDLAVTAAGTTIYELMALGVPTVCFALADDQLQVSALDGVVDWLGSIRGPAQSLDPIVLRRVIKAAEELLSPDARRALLSRSEDLIDTQGALRLAAALSEEAGLTCSTKMKEKS